MPYIWLDATYVKCRRDGHVASTAIVTAIGCDSDGWRHVLGISVVDAESYGSVFRQPLVSQNSIRSFHTSA